MQKSNKFYETQVGIEFEFMREPDYSKSQIKQDLEKILGVGIKVEKGHHTEFTPTEHIFKMEDDFSGGKNLIELITGPLNYVVAKRVITLVLGYIKNNKNLFTTNKCGIHLNLNYPNENYIKNIDILKFILLFDEEQVYSRFPGRRGNIYTKSIKNIEPLSTNFDFRNIEVSKTNFKYPSTKYYGVNFEKLSKGYLEFRYIGGENYDQQSTEILELLDYFLFSLKNAYETPYNNDCKEELRNILSNKKMLFEAGKSYFNFKNIFKNIKITVDGSDNEEVIKSFFAQIYGIFFPVMSNMMEIKYTKSGRLNYDTDKALLEFVDFYFKKTVIEKNIIVFSNCKFEGSVIKDALLLDCETKNCDLITVEAHDCKLDYTRLKDGIYDYCKVKGGYINGKDFIIRNSELSGNLIFREGSYEECEISDEVEIIEAKKVEQND